MGEAADQKAKQAALERAISSITSANGTAAGASDAFTQRAKGRRRRFQFELLDQVTLPGLQTIASNRFIRSVKAGIFSHRVDDSMVAVIALSPTLTELDIASCSLNPASGLLLSRNTNLIKLNVQKTKIGAESARELLSHSRLTELAVDVPNDDCIPPELAPSLTALDIRGESLGTNSMHTLATCTHLRSLCLRVGATISEQFLNTALSSLASSPSLTHLALETSTRVSNEALICFSNLPHFRSLSLIRAPLCEGWAGALARSSTLATLTLESLQAVTPNELRALRESKIQTLSLLRAALGGSEFKIDDECAQELAAMPCLTYLDLSCKCSIGPPGAQALAKCKTLEHVFLYSDVKKVGASALARLPHLVELRLGRVTLTRGAITCLANNDTLQILHVGSLKDEHLRILASSNSLLSLSGSGSKSGFSVTGLGYLERNTNLTTLDVRMGGLWDLKYKMICERIQKRNQRLAYNWMRVVFFLVFHRGNRLSQLATGVAAQAVISQLVDEVMYFLTPADVEIVPATQVPSTPTHQPSRSAAPSPVHTTQMNRISPRHSPKRNVASAPSSPQSARDPLLRGRSSSMHEKCCIIC